MKDAHQIDSLLKKYGDVLRLLRGAPLREAWLVLDEQHSAVHPASPLVLVFDRVQIELWSIYLTDFTITTAEIDIRKPPFIWNGDGQSDGAWTADASRIVSSRVGRVVSNVALLAEPENHCRGLELAFDDGAALVAANSFDELFLGEEVPAICGLSRIGLDGEILGMIK